MLTDFFKENGLKKSGNIWYKINEDVILLCECQSSTYFNGFYLNFGIYFEKIQPLNSKIPKSIDWHFESRYDRLLKGIKSNVNQIIELDLNNTEMVNELKSNIKKYIIPQLIKVGDKKYLKENFPNNFDHEKWWLQNIREKDMVNLLRN